MMKERITRDRAHRARGPRDAIEQLQGHHPRALEAVQNRGKADEFAGAPERSRGGASRIGKKIPSALSFVLHLRMSEQLGNRALSIEIVRSVSVSFVRLASCASVRFASCASVLLASCASATQAPSSTAPVASGTAAASSSSVASSNVAPNATTSSAAGAPSGNAATTPSDPRAALPPGYEALEQHMTAALYRSKDGDGAGCLKELDLADGIDPRRAAQRWITRATCEMQSGKCDEGRARFRGGLDGAPTPRHLRADELDTATASFAAHNCPRKSLNPRERVLADASALYDAKRRHDADFCAREGLALVPLVSALAFPGSSDDVSRGLGIADLNAATDCAASGGRCDDARTIHAAYFKLLQTKLTDAQVDDAFARSYPGCK